MSINLIAIGVACGMLGIALTIILEENTELGFVGSALVGLGGTIGLVISIAFIFAHFNIL